MFAGTVEELKVFMSLLLKGTLFDTWEVTEARAETFFSLSVNGRLKKDFFEEPDIPERNFAEWGEVKGIFYQAVRGKRLPGVLQVVLAAEKKWTGQILSECGKEREEAGAVLYLNIRYTASGCQLVGGVSHAGFTMDKTLDVAWDAALRDFLKVNGIAVSTQ